MGQALVSRAVLGSTLFLVACASDPPPPPPAPVAPRPQNLLTVAADPLVENVDPTIALPVAGQPRPERDTFTARVVPGMERVDSVASTDVALCVLAPGKAPICIHRSEPPRFVPGPSEVLRKWLVADGIDCRLSAQNKLDCFGSSGAVSMPAVQDFVLAQNLHLYTLAAGGTVTLTQLARQGDPRARAAIFRNAVEIEELSGTGACARSSGGAVTCADEASAFTSPVNVIRGIGRATHLAPGMVRDDSATLFGIGENEAGVDHAWGALRLGSGITDLATVGAPAREICVLLAAGGVRCRPTLRGEAEERRHSDVTVPGAAKRFHPSAAPCIELQNGTVACWGPDLERLERLGLRVLELSPGSIAPR